jgi:hypothetical protein
MIDQILEDLIKRQVCLKFSPYNLMNEQREDKIITGEDFIAM